MAIQLDFIKLPSDKRIAVWGGPSGGAFGIQDVDVPTEAELNNDGDASGMIPFSQSLSWSDTELPGMRASESTNEPSLADDAGYEEFGPSNYDATLSMFRPREYDDASNPHSLVYDLTDLTDWRTLDFAVRIDGDKDALAEAEDGDYVSVTRQQMRTETESYNFEESARRTVGFDGVGGFAHYTIVGDHTLTVEEGIGNVSEGDKGDQGPKGDKGDKGRVLVSVQGRDYTNALRYSTDDPEVVLIYPGGFYEITGEGTATVTVEDEGAGESTTIQVTV